MLKWLFAYKQHVSRLLPMTEEQFLFMMSADC